jgi:2'-hydroxyisoflavone reductase
MDHLNAPNHGSLSRRSVLAAAVASVPALAAIAAASSAGSSAAASPRLIRLTRPPGAGKHILILGGTGFLGPALIDAAQARGHTLTLFNRGKTEKRKPGQFDNLNKLYGNRDPKLRADDADPESPLGLSALEGKSFDAVVDTSGYFPRHAAASAKLLRDNVKHYTFISTFSVYKDNDTPGADESAPVGVLDEPAVETMGDQQQNYGPLKALCEQAVEAEFPGRTLNIRPGFIVGPNDPTDRFTYWPVRFTRPAEDGDVACPGDGSDPVMVIDVRDLAEWIIRCIETSTTGVFNASGPPIGSPAALSFKDVITACASEAEARRARQPEQPAPQVPRPVWVPLEVLSEQGIPAPLFPIWLPKVGEVAGFHSRSIARAVDKGLTFRPISETVKAVLDAWPAERSRRIVMTAKMRDDAKAAGKPEPKMADPTVLRAGVPAAAERALLAALAERSVKPEAPTDKPAPEPKP